MHRAVLIMTALLLCACASIPAYSLDPAALDGGVAEGGVVDSATTDSGQADAADPRPPSGYVFLTNPVLGDMGIGATNPGNEFRGDVFCKNAADGSDTFKLKNRNWRAWLWATALPNDGGSRRISAVPGGWRNVRDVPIGTVTDPNASRALRTLTLTADGSQMTENDSAWGGEFGVDCAGWTNATTSRSGSFWWLGQSAGTALAAQTPSLCHFARRIFCFEQP
jgi:hypothetical protein